MRFPGLAAMVLVPATALGADESVVSIESSDGAGWRLTCAWEGETAVDWRGGGAEVFRFPPGRLDCIIALERSGALRLEASGAGGSRSTTTLTGSGRSRFSLR